MSTDNNKRSLSLIMFTTIGVVYGDIGTSPLYTIRECFSNSIGINVERNAIFGFLSLIFWLLILVVSIKYIIFVMHADNTGEGGILTLMTLAKCNFLSQKILLIIIVIGLIGSSFFYGEVVITPAISILSSIEGLSVIAPQLNIWIIPLSVVILTLLFLIQKYGTEVIGKLFAPVMFTWFLVLAVLGISSIILNLDILYALNPIWMIRFFLKYKSVSFAALGAIALSITGAEALYANISHFGKLPIRLTWFIVILPSLLLNYFGQGALLLRNPEAIKNPFFLLAPEWALTPMITIATLATVIASQAVISGVFSLTRQAIQLGYLPPMRILHTSATESNQIYIPFVNWLLYFTIVIVIFNFKHSSNLAAAYGISVTGTMILTSILSVAATYQNWNWNKFYSWIILVIFLCMDIPLFFANFDKIFSGGWLPLTLGLIMFIIMNTWKSERFHLLCLIKKYSYPITEILSLLEKYPPIRVSGNAVYMSRELDAIPYSLILNLKHNKVLHKQVILLTLCIKDTPYVYSTRRMKIKRLSSVFWCVKVNYGWRETLNVEEIFRLCSIEGLICRMAETSFFISHESLTIGKRPWYLQLRGKLYLVLQHHALHALDQFEIPVNHVIELGIQIEI